MSFFGKSPNKERKEEPKEESLPWIEPTQNPFGVRLLDLRPITQTMLATSSNPQMAQMEKLSELGANPDSPSAEGATPLMNAVQSNKTDHVNLLLQSGANANAIDKRGFTSLHRAAEMGHLDIVNTLLKSGADKNSSSGGHTALSFAEKRGHEEIVKVLRG